MGIFNNLRQFLGVKKKSAGNNDHWINIGGGADGVNDRNLLLNNKEWVFIAVDKVAGAVASIRFKVMRYQRNGDDQEVFDGPLVDFLENPAQGFTGKDFIYLNTAWKELTGNAFWEKDKFKKLNPMIPTNVSPVIDNNGSLLGYRYTQGGNQRVIVADKVLHDRYMNPANPYWGVGKLAKIARWVDTSAYSNEFLRRFFLNGATFGGFLETEEETEDRIKLIKAGLANDHTGVENAHKIGVLPKGTKYSKTTANMGEIEMGATDDRYRDKILAGFGVPKTLVGLTTEVNRASAEASEYIFARYTIKPIADDLLEFLNFHIAPLLDSSDKYYFAYDEFIPVNVDAQLKEREIALNRQPYKTVNEVRAEVGLPPVKGGDVVYAPPFQSPLGEPQASPDPAPNDNGNEDPTPPKKSIPRRIRQTEKKNKSIDNIVNIISKAVEDIEATKDMDAEAHKDFVGRVSSFLERMENAVRVFNSEQQSRVRANLARATKDVSKGDLMDMDEEVGAMINFVYPILRGVMTEQALAEWEAQGFEGAFDNNSESLIKTIERATKRLAKSYNNTTVTLLKKALNEGITAGDGLDGLTKRVQEIYEFSDKVRAKSVAHTESFYIANKGNKEAYKQSGVVKTIRWYTSEDERVCVFCGPLHGKIVGVQENFFKKGDVYTVIDGKGQSHSLNLNYRTIGEPPIHTNCNCFIRPEEISIE
ncbi:MAG: phage portal protein [Nitrosomonas sp.]|uniref:phage portal protein n=1 Tax=Nitrosomonas sp. TaxID=42353 RepID=UPI0032EE394E